MRIGRLKVGITRGAHLVRGASYSHDHVARHWCVDRFGMRFCVIWFNA